MSLLIKVENVFFRRLLHIDFLREVKTESGVLFIRLRRWNNNKPNVKLKHIPVQKSLRFDKNNSMPPYGGDGGKGRAKTKVTQNLCDLAIILTPYQARRTRNQNNITWNHLKNMSVWKFLKPHNIFVHIPTHLFSLPDTRPETRERIV